MEGILLRLKRSGQTTSYRKIGCGPVYRDPTCKTTVFSVLWIRWREWQRHEQQCNGVVWLLHIKAQVERWPSWKQMHRHDRKPCIKCTDSSLQTRQQVCQQVSSGAFILLYFFLKGAEIQQKDLPKSVIFTTCSGDLPHVCRNYFGLWWMPNLPFLFGSGWLTKMFNVGLFMTLVKLISSFASNYNPSYPGMVWPIIRFDFDSVIIWWVNEEEALNTTLAIWS